MPSLLETLDPEILAHAEMLRSGAVPLTSSTVTEIRAAAADLRRGWNRHRPDMHAVSEASFEGMGYRHYRPVADARLPAVVFLHGGGWTLMGLDTHDAIARAIAAESGAAVLSLDYPLAPEAPFPAAPEACCRFLRHVTVSSDSLGLVPGAVALAVDSAGANLAVSAALAARDAGEPAGRGFGLIYGSWDLSNLERDSYRRYAGGELPFTRERMNFFRDSYVPDRVRRTDPRASPLFADLAGLPPAFLAVASHDALYDENFLFASHLGTAGVDVTLKVYPGTIHGFAEAANAVGAMVAKRALADTGAFLARVLAA
jgi:acetyl esterase